MPVVSREELREVVGAVAATTMREIRIHRQRSKRLRKEANYVESTPRCGSCLNFQHSLRDQQGNATGHACRLLACNVMPNGLCDWWTGRDGSTLEAA